MADTNKIATLLNQLEAVFAPVAAKRQHIDRQFGTGWSEPREAQLKVLAEETADTLERLQAQLDQEFATAQQEARQQVNQARAGFHNGPQGKAYLAALAGYGPIGAAMPTDLLVQKLNDALDSGLVGEARALAEVLDLNRNAHPEATINLPAAAAVERAKAEAYTPQELAAQAEYNYVDTAYKRYKVNAGLTIASRLDNAQGGKDDLHAGYLSSDAVLTGNLPNDPNVLYSSNDDVFSN
jgi:hypothetical protein